MRALIQRAIYVLNYIMIIDSVQADFPKIHNLRVCAGLEIEATGLDAEDATVAL